MKCNTWLKHNLKNQLESKLFCVVVCGFLSSKMDFAWFWGAQNWIETQIFLDSFCKQSLLKDGLIDLGVGLMVCGGVIMVATNSLPSGLGAHFRILGAQASCEKNQDLKMDRDLEAVRTSGSTRTSRRANINEGRRFRRNVRVGQDLMLGKVFISVLPPVIMPNVVVPSKRWLPQYQLCPVITCRIQNA